MLSAWHVARASESVRNAGFLRERSTRAEKLTALMSCAGDGFRCLPSIEGLLAVLLSDAWGHLPTSRSGSVVNRRRSKYLFSSVVLVSSVSVVRLRPFGHSVKGIVFRGSLSSWLSDAVVFVNETRSSRRRCSRRGRRMARRRRLRWALLFVCYR